MGHRPSVKNEGNNSDSSSLKSQNNNNESSHEGDYNSPSSKSLSTSPSTPQREAWTVRGQLLLNFHHAISRAINSPEMARKCSQIAEDMSRSEQEIQITSQPSPSNCGTKSQNNGPAAGLKSLSSMAEEYSAEAALIVENKSKRDAAVRNKSLALGLFSFVTLRSGRGLSSWVRKSIANSRVGGSYQFEKTPAWSNAVSTVELKQPSKLRRFFRLALDATISTSITLLSGAYLFMPRPSAYIEDMSKLPLVEGKSVYAEMVCPPLLKEYRRVLEQYGGRWPVRGTTSDVEDGKTPGDATVPQLTQEDVSLNVIRAFVENCSKRSKYERALLEEKNALNFDNNQSTSRFSRLTRNSESIGDDNLSEAANKLGTISVPSPGVPENIPVNLDQDVFSLATDDDDEEDEGDGENSKI